MTATVDGERRPLDLAFRHASAADLAACGAIWRRSINDYIGRLGQPEIPDELGPITRLYAHLLATDPVRFVVAATPDAAETDGERVVGFALAVVRDRVWFLSMLFVLPEVQSTGVGRGLLERVLPDPADGLGRATGTDSAQPISNALYASYGLVPRMPLLNLIGLPERPEAFEPLPSGVTPVAFDDLAGGVDGHAELVAIVDGLDRQIVGFTHPADHRYLRTESRRGWLYRGPDGAPVGYGYTSEAGRMGPVVVADPSLLAPAIGHLAGVLAPRGALSIWLPGAAGAAVTATLRAGFRLQPFPVLLCWDRQPADFERYAPISPGLL